MSSKQLAAVWNPSFTPSQVAEALPGVPTLEMCAKEMAAAIIEFQNASHDTVEAAIRIGHAAETANMLIPRGEFIPWVEQNFKITIQWINACRRAARSWDKLQSHPSRDAILARANSIEKLAALLKPLEEGDDVAAVLDAPKAPKAPRKLKLEKGAPDDVSDAEDKSLEKKAADLASWEVKLDRREKALDGRERDLDERERLVALREAAPVLPIPTASEVVADHGLEAARAAARDIASHGLEAARAAAREKTKGMRKLDAPAIPKPKKAPKLSPETVAAIQNAARGAIAPAKAPETAQEASNGPVATTGTVSEKNAPSGAGGAGEAL